MLEMYGQTNFAVASGPLYGAAIFGSSLGPLTAWPAVSISTASAQWGTALFLLLSAIVSMAATFSFTCVMPNMKLDE